MTIVAALKVSDGVIVGADAAGVVTARRTEPPEQFLVTDVFAAAIKIFPFERWPMAAVFWGSSAVGDRTIGSLVDEFGREKLLSIQPSDKAVRNVAQSLQDLLDAQFCEAYPGLVVVDEEQQPAVNALVCGYAPGNYHSEAYEIGVPKTQQGRFTQVWSKTDEYSLAWRGQTEPLTRLLCGYSEELVPSLVQYRGFLKEETGTAFDQLVDLLRLDASYGAMPLQEALDMVRWMLEVTVGYFRYQKGPALCSKPIHTLVITPQGYEWKDRPQLL